MTASTTDDPDLKATAAAFAVLDAHMAAINADDEEALLATLHFPHYRLSRGRMQIWETPDNYLNDFHARATDEWHHSAWGFRNVIAADSEKVHLDVEFTRFRGDGSVIVKSRSLWIVTCLDGRWAAQTRSSFAT